MQTSHLIQSDDFSNISVQKHSEESAAREYLNSLIINRTEGWHKKQQFDFCGEDAEFTQKFFDF